jgi:hypothetical protein
MSGISEFVIAAADSSLPNIATVNGRPEEAHGNAHLIAAAPEMLIALEHAVRWWNNQKSLDAAPWIYVVRNAIALAGKD